MVSVLGIRNAPPADPERHPATRYGGFNPGRAPCNSLVIFQPAATNRTAIALGLQSGGGDKRFPGSERQPSAATHQTGRSDLLTAMNRAAFRSIRLRRLGHARQQFAVLSKKRTQRERSVPTVGREAVSMVFFFLPSPFPLPVSPPIPSGIVPPALVSRLVSALLLILILVNQGTQEKGASGMTARKKKVPSWDG